MAFWMIFPHGFFLSHPFVEGKATITYYAILFPNELLTEFELIHVGLVMCTDLERAMVDDLTIQFGDDHHIQWVLFLFSTPRVSLNLVIFRA